MNPEARLADILTALESVGLSYLVLGGHAARYYGVSRTTSDYDLHLAPDGWDDLPARLSRCALFQSVSVIEGPSWRPGQFRRFQIGRLPDGREEWLEFWRSNHLLAPFPELYNRCEIGQYGGRAVPFLSLPDLIRSKETERESDWLDIALLEEILDARHLAAVKAGTAGEVTALSHLRSRQGFASCLAEGHLENPITVNAALLQVATPMTAAYLLPAATSPASSAGLEALEPIVVDRLRRVSPGSPLHLALTEAVRRQYKLGRQEADHADKKAVRASQHL